MTLTKAPELAERFKALTHPTRIRALVAFSEPRGRVATPTEIAGEMGVAPDRLNYHVRELARYGWLELVQEARKAGTGVIERYYRAAELAAFDADTWAQMSPSERQVATEDAISHMVADIAAADETGSLYSKAEAHASRTPLVLDEPGWAELEAGLMQLYEASDRIAADTVNRVARNGAHAPVDLISTRLLALFFPTAGPDDPAHEPAPASGRNDAPGEATAAAALSLSTRLRALTHPLRVRALHALNGPHGRVATQAQIARELGVSVEQLNHHVHVLVESGWMEVVDRRRRAGRVQNLYRSSHAGLAPLYDATEWVAMSASQRRRVTSEIVGLILADVTAAAAAQTLDSRLDRHLHRAPLVLDERGLRDLEAQMSALAGRAQQIGEETFQRVTSGETPAAGCTPACFALLHFEAAAGGGNGTN